MRWIKYGTQSDIRFTMVKRAVVDLAVSADWTPAGADSAISKDGGNYADTTNTVAIVGGSPTRSVAGWKLTISATEAQAAEINIQIVDAATKAVEDQFLTVYTYGNASAKFAGDWSDIVRLGLTAIPNVASGSAGALLVDGTGTAAISNSAGKVLLQATQSGVTIPTVTTVTNQLTAGAIATGIWQDTTAGDFTTALSVGKSVMNGVSLGTGLTIASVSGAVGSLTTNNDKTGYALSATGSAALTESYAADGVAPTLNQILYQLWSFLAEKNISGTTLTAKKLDGATTAMTFTLDSSTAPTTITRAT